MTKLTISEMKKAINDFKQSVVAMPKTVTYVPDKSKFKTGCCRLLDGYWSWCYCS